MESALDLLHQTMSSPWVYLAIFAIAVVDGFFPVVPSETAVITAGVFAATGQPELWAVIAVAATGALVGDHISYAIGRGGGRLLARLPERGRRRAAYGWASRGIAKRGGLILTVARYIPGGRTAVTMTMGATRFPRPRFLAFDLLAAGTWGLYSALVGYLGGLAFEQDPLRGLLLGLGLALTVTVIVETARWAHRRRRARSLLAVGQPSSLPAVGQPPPRVC
ncbi:DedA family protein [Micromonospora endophytica]|uniref:DedA protein n=1 Tax=Micromonospora endophytica TaxID=515350 RepID=A0A2W2CWF1_9ACTN|nr:DedA family protein [Micromonospora endophytica]PZF97634.1 DedA protein [Micromonospora endophytica]RIW46853.1 DedA family protein [Micromonospora endophytica]BCJ59253.1 membrane protein [Micromonospora endophytica]